MENLSSSTRYNTHFLRRHGVEASNILTWWNGTCHRICTQQIMRNMYYVHLWLAVLLCRVNSISNLQLLHTSCSIYHLNHVSWLVFEPWRRCIYLPLNAHCRLVGRPLIRFQIFSHTFLFCVKRKRKANANNSWKNPVDGKDRNGVESRK